ncbi:glycosyltransferase [Adonisia turfae]|uniref:Glycosyltransferase n=1 Tax=Adonisia turfae CCMR0081 TaxID=2292702 RepID=A0A6M0RRF2_9CYAN|nr:glycosyltransferase family 4 protein [Adonisia turfae]NEZ58818.1 hypothetical protein [Adonisia turfae CCMR0081]
MKSFRIFIGVVEIAGYYGNLAFALREQGHLVTVAGASGHVFEYEGQHSSNPFIIRIYDALLKALALKQLSTSKSINHLVRKKLLEFLTSLTRVVLFLWALPKHEVFILGFGSSFLPKGFDLPILKLLNKRLICNIAHGSEARPPYINGGPLESLNDPITKGDLHTIKRATKIIKIRCSKIEKYADIVVGAPLTSHFLEKPFINIFHLGLTFKSQSASNINNNALIKNIRILHCPSNPAVKGTSLIRNAIASLKDKGYPIEFIELIGKPNTTVLKELRLCDFVVDQAYSDFPLPGFATEAAWFAKPSVVGGYGWPFLKKLIPNNIFPPSHLCHPAQLEESIEKLIVDIPYRQDLGNKAQIFVKENWSLQKTADRYLQLINGDFPRNWWAIPCQINYLQGCGVSEKKLLKVLPQLLQEGKDVLQLKDKPSLEKAFIDFCISK